MQNFIEPLKASPSSSFSSLIAAYLSVPRLYIRFPLFATFSTDLPPILSCFLYFPFALLTIFFKTFSRRRLANFSRSNSFFYRHRLLHWRNVRKQVFIKLMCISICSSRSKIRLKHCPYYFRVPTSLLQQFGCVMNSSSSLSLHSAILLQTQLTSLHECTCLHPQPSMTSLIFYAFLNSFQNVLMPISLPFESLGNGWTPPISYVMSIHNLTSTNWTSFFCHCAINRRDLAHSTSCWHSLDCHGRSILQLFSTFLTRREKDPPQPNFHISELTMF